MKDSSAKKLFKPSISKEEEESKQKSIKITDASNGSSVKASPDASNVSSVKASPDASNGSSVKVSTDDAVVDTANVKAQNDISVKAPRSDFKSFLKDLRQKAKNERDKGDLFERAIRDFLKNSPEHSFEDVWMRRDWPDLEKYGFPVQDLGIDLVAKEKETGRFWAIQCKCYDESYQVNKSNIDSFFTESGKRPFEVRLIVTTTNNWGANAEEALKSQTKECKVLGLYDLERVDFEWSPKGVKRKKVKKILRPHQREAVQRSVEHFKTQGRGKLIMACGTGKTFTSCRITEEVTSQSAVILFLAPSISLISQTLREYAYERKSSQRYIVVCSDAKAGKDSSGVDIKDLQISPTTDSRKIAERLKMKSQERTIVFSTYQSLKQVKKAQDLGAPEFDLVICDEAHRTTGVEGSERKDQKTKGNYFTMINDEDYVKAKKRLYMTATPRIYSEKVKSVAKKQEVEIHSMDEEKVYGKEIYRLDFSKAIEQDLLSDYKVIILSIDEQYMSDTIQEALTDTDLKLADASRLVGCYKALRDQGNEKTGSKLNRAVAFLSTIKNSKDAKDGFKKVVDILDSQELANNKNDYFTCETEHIDGTDSSIKRNKKLDWLKEDTGFTESGETICRILMNSKCLTEGIDVPSLDAVMFLHPRKSQVDVVQAVGRVIRKQEGKSYGYVILPVVIPVGKSPEQALNDNKTYKAVWQVLNALRSHDSEFDSLVNNLELNKQKPDKIKVVGIGFGSEAEEKEFEERTDSQIRLSLQYSIEEIEEKVYAKIVEKCGDRVYEEKWAKEIEQACKTISIRIKSLLDKRPEINKQFENYYKGLKSSINEDIPKKEAISMLSEHIITRPAFDKIFENYKFSENNPVSKTMKKVLDKLDVYNFRNELKDLEKFYEGIAKRLGNIDNSAGRQKVIKELYENFIKTAFPKTAQKLGVAYTPIEIVDFIIKSTNEILRQEFNKGLTDEGVHIIDPFVGTGTFINRMIQIKNETTVLSDKKFSSHRPLSSHRPNEKNYHLEVSNEKNQKLNQRRDSTVSNEKNQNTNESYIIKKQDLARKFKKEFHANEMLLLPYYVSSINIEEAYHNRMEGRYKQFPGITLTDTFNIYEQKDNALPLFQENKERIKRQKESAIRVIIGNPPYSVGQGSENDGNKNTVHPLLHKKIEKTYVKESNTTNKNALYDSYIKAIRWATDRIGNEGGVVGFVHNASLVNERSIGGLRKSLVKEFDSIYCFNLRGNQRTKGELAKKEGGKVFGGSSRTPVAITFLVKSASTQNKPAKIKYYDIGDYLSREEKLERIKNFGSILGIEKEKKWQDITPDKYGDWIKQRDDSFYEFLPIGDKKDKTKKSIFDLYSCGVKTNRDSWVYNFDEISVKTNMQKMIKFYNQEMDRLKDKNLSTKNMDRFIDRDEKKIKWSGDLKKEFLKDKSGIFNKNQIQVSSYRPFTKSYLYFDRMFNNSGYHNNKIFPKSNIENKVICVSGIGAKTFSVLMTDAVPCLDFIEKSQCFPLYRFDEIENKQKNLLEDTNFSYSITDFALNEFKTHYANQQITKEDIFYYIYGLLHSKEYREKYKDNLDKSLPHIPLAPKFWEFLKAGRKLSELHLNYEKQKPPKDLKVLKNGKEIHIDLFYKNSQTLNSMLFKGSSPDKKAMESLNHPNIKKQVQEKTFAKVQKDLSQSNQEHLLLPEGLSPIDLKIKKMRMDKKDKSKIQFNEHITITGIPEKAWDYKINGWSAPKWVMERYQYKQDKKTDIINDPNTYSKDPAYILKLLLSVITVSLKTQELVQSLPTIDFESLTRYSMKKTA